VTLDELASRLKVAFKGEAEGETKRFLRERAGCTPFHRFRLAVLRGDWTPEEWKHLQECAFCRKVLVKVMEHIWHPSVEQIRGYILGSLGEPDLTDVRHHLEEDRCCLCLAVRDIIEPAARATTFPPVVALTRKPFSLRAVGTSPKAGESITIEGEAKGVRMVAQILREERGWVARAQVEGPPLEGAVIRFRVIKVNGEGKWDAESPLALASGGRWASEVVLAPPEESIGDAYFIAALLPVKK